MTTPNPNDPRLQGYPQNPPVGQPVTPNQPVVPNTPVNPPANAIPNQPVVPPAPNQPVIPNQPVVQQPVAPNRPVVPNQPVVQQPPGAPNQPVPVPPAAPNQPVVNTPVPAVPNQPVPNQPVTNQPVPQQPANPAAYAYPPTHQPTSQPVPVTPGAARTTTTATSPTARVPATDNRPRPVQTTAARPIPVTSKSAMDVDDPDAEEDTSEVTEEFVRQIPSWAISALVHTILILALLLIPLLDDDDSPLELQAVYAEDLGEQLLDDSLDDLALDSVDPNVTEPILSEDILEVEDPLASTVNLEDILSELETAEPIEAPSIGFALTGREKGKKEALLAKYGGNATTEAAVKRGLEWLKRNQLKDGGWSLLGPYSQGAGLGAGIENKASATAMALLAFQGAGHTHKSGEYRDVVKRGWDAMLRMQGSDGNFYVGNVPQQSLYTQAQCAIAVCELYGMTNDPKFKQPAELAIEYCAEAQAPEGGWKYHPRVDSDMSVTGWFVMAFMSAKMAGLQVPDKTLENITRFIDSVAIGDGSRFCYMPGYTPTHIMTAEALLCRQYLGWKKDDPRLVAGVRHLLEQKVNYSEPNVYYWYYATQVTHHIEGQFWKDWNKVMRQEVPENQMMTGKEKGSWDPTTDRWGHHGGRLYVTCLSIYMLEVYYRHLPIYKYRATKLNK